MSEMTYTRCPVCRGTLCITPEASTDREPACWPVNCPCARTASPGWAPTGLTLGQLDRLADVERALAGDPGLPEERRRAVLVTLRRRLREAESRLPLQREAPGD